MKKVDRLNLIRQWQAENPEMEVPVLVEKVMAEFEVAEGTAMNYINEASKPTDGTASKNVTKKRFMAIAKGQSEPGFDDETLEKFIDFDSEDTASLELERREYHPATGKKMSKPQIVHFNRSDLLAFLKVTKEKIDKNGKQVEVEVCEGRAILGMVNVIYHIPKKWNIKAACDPWPE